MRLYVFVSCLATTVSLFLPALSMGSGETVLGFHLYRYSPVGFVLIPVILAVFCAEIGILPEFFRKTVVFAVTFFGAAGIIVAIIETKIILESVYGTTIYYGWGIPFVLLSFMAFVFAAKEPNHNEQIYSPPTSAHTDDF